MPRGTGKRTCNRLVFEVASVGLVSPPRLHARDGAGGKLEAQHSC